MDKLIELAKYLNSSIPQGALRRNSTDYELVTYINHIISFLICEMYDEAALFAMRASKYLVKNSSSNNVYYKKCKEFLDNVIQNLIEGDLVSEYGAEFLKRIG